MTFSYQDLKSDRPNAWTHGRVWIRRGGDWSRRRFGTLGIEWHAPKGSRWGITFGDGDSGRNFQITFSIPFLLTVYITFHQAFKRQLFVYDFDRGQDRDISISFYDNAIWWHFWVGTMASWSRKYPWCKPWRQGSFHFASLLGRQSCKVETIQEGIPVKIPMPEGVYDGVAKVERYTWKRPLWFARQRMDTYIQVERGIPFQGKGENSWDCGDDGIFGTGVSWLPGATHEQSLERAIAHYATAVMDNRKRYGRPSAEAITEALGVTP